MKKIFLPSKIAAIIIILLSSISLAQADTYTLQSDKKRDAALPASWGASNFTTSGDIFIIPASIPDAVFKSLTVITFGEGVTLQVDGIFGIKLFGSTNTILTIQGTILFNSTSSQAIVFNSQSFVLGNSGTLKTKNTTGILGSECSIENNGGTVTLPGSANYEFNGTTQGSTGLPTDITGSVTIANGATVTISTLTLGSGGTLNVNPQGAATITTLTNNGGTFRHLSDESGIASVIFDSYSDSGTEDFEMYLTGGGGPNYAWHYIAVPGTMAKTAFTDVNIYNLLLWDESKIVNNDMQAWQWHDGYGGTTGFSTLYAKTGYNFYHTSDYVTIDLDPVSSLLSDLGTYNLQWTEDGKNLIGNSLTCSIAWDAVGKTGSMREAIYFTKDNGIVTYVNGTGSPPNSGVIPPLQGFFVKALAGGASLDFTAAGVNVHGTVNRYKSKSIIPLIRLELQKDAKVMDETVIRFDYNATDTVDNKFDATKIFSESLDISQIYTEMNSEKYIINGINFPDESKSVPVSVKITEAGNYMIKRTQLQGLDNYDLTLTDTYENSTINLEEIGQYTFSSDVGTFTDRFIFTISTITTGLDDVTLDNKKFNIYIYSDNLNIAPLSPEWDNVKADVNVYDLTGRRIQSHAGMMWYTGETKQLGFARPKGIYIVEIVAGNNRAVQKISHR